MTDFAEEIALDQRNMLHPWHSFDAMQIEGASVVTKGHGLNIWDQHGRRYVDAVGGLWCTNIGLGREEVGEAVADQIRELAYANTFVDQGNLPAARLAGKIASLSPGNLNRVFFTTGGSTAIDSSVRLINFYQSSRGKPGKRHLIARREAYHGSTYLGMSLGNRAGDRLTWFNYVTDFVHHVSAPYSYRRPEGIDEAEFCDFLIEELEAKILELGPENVAAFFAEPISGAGGVIVPPEDYNRRCREVTRKYDVLYVADEVVTAFGRLGYWFSSKDVYDVQPDIITVAKGLSSAYLPIGATILSDEIFRSMEAGDPHGYFANGFTYSGHPVCCAAALKNIEIMERENLLGNVRRVAPYFMERLNELYDLPIVGDVRGKGFMAGIENVANKATRETLPEELAVGRRIFDRAAARGLLVRPIGHVNVMSPALTMSEADVDFIVDTLRRSISEVVDEFVREGVRIG